MTVTETWLGLPPSHPPQTPDESAVPAALCDEVSASPEIEAAPAVVVADDDAETLAVVTEQLADSGYCPIGRSDADGALQAIRGVRPSLAVLDASPHGLGGLAVLQAVRRISDLPVILTIAGSDLDRVIGLRAGADDCMSKPFNPLELTARVDAVLRRTSTAAPAAPPERVEAGPLSIDTRLWSASIAGEALPLRPRQFDLLLTLVRHRGIALHRDRLLDLVWGPGYEGDRRTIDVHVAGLRGMLARGGLQIQTVRNVGYRLV
jgi:DNA-binding response OmpR family regulator